MKTLGLIFLMASIFFMGYYAGKSDGLYDGARGLEMCQNNHATGYYFENNEIRCIF